MKTPPSPENEEQRLQSLRKLDLLDTPPEYRFDRITRLATQSLDTPYAEINLIDEDRQWSKSQYGLEDPETPREVSFCAHTMLKDGLTLLSDAREDDRFRGNPCVEQFPHIRFYMSFPLETPEGHPSGTLCVFDDRPRTPSEEQIETFKQLASMAQEELYRQQVLVPRIQTIISEHGPRLPDIHHVVRNNLQVIMSLLKLEQREHSGNALMERFCRKMKSRTQGLSLLYDYVKQSGDGYEVNLNEFCEALVHHLPRTLGDGCDVTFEVAGSDMDLPIEQASPMSLLLIELLSNALQHAFPDGTEGEVLIDLEVTQDNQHVVTVADNGAGLPEPVNWRDPETLGLKLIRNLGERQLHGKLDCQSQNGTRFTIRFPDDQDRSE